MFNASYLRRVIVSKSHPNKKDDEEKKDEEKNDNGPSPLISGAPGLLGADFELVKLQVNQAVTVEKQEIVTNVFRMAEDSHIQRLFLDNEGFRNLISLPLQSITIGTLALQGVEETEERSVSNSSQDLLTIAEERWFQDGVNSIRNSTLSNELNIEHIEGTAGSVPNYYNQKEIKNSDLFIPIMGTVVVGIVLYRMSHLVSSNLVSDVKSWGVKLISDSFRSLGVLLEPKFVM